MYYISGEKEIVFAKNKRRALRVLDNAFNSTCLKKELEPIKASHVIPYLKGFYTKYFKLYIDRYDYHRPCKKIMDFAYDHADIIYG